jgi:hypothetical protein
MKYSAHMMAKKITNTFAKAKKILSRPLVVLVEGGAGGGDDLMVFLLLR